MGENIDLEDANIIFMVKIESGKELFYSTHSRVQVHSFPEMGTIVLILGR